MNNKDKVILDQAHVDLESLWNLYIDDVTHEAEPGLYSKMLSIEAVQDFLLWATITLETRHTGVS